MTQPWRLRALERHLRAWQTGTYVRLATHSACATGFLWGYLFLFHVLWAPVPPPVWTLFVGIGAGAAVAIILALGLHLLPCRLAPHRRTHVPPASPEERESAESTIGGPRVPVDPILHAPDSTRAHFGPTAALLEAALWNGRPEFLRTDDGVLTIRMHATGLYCQPGHLRIWLSLPFACHPYARAVRTAVGRANWRVGGWRGLLTTHAQDYMFQLSPSGPPSAHTVLAAKQAGIWIEAYEMLVDTPA